jgi:hypothetical protein
LHNSVFYRNAEMDKKKKNIYVVGTTRWKLWKYGYAVVPVLTPDEVAHGKAQFHAWQDANPALKAQHRRIDPHGILKYGGAGTTRFAMETKLKDSVQAPFREIWGTPFLVTSMDGCCYIEPDAPKSLRGWVHTDQAPNREGLACVQGYVSYTTNTERTIILYEGSHRLHANYFAERGIKSSKNWQLIDEAYLETIADLKRVVHVNAGEMVLWDSRTFHMGGNLEVGEERLVQYVCFLPRHSEENTATEQAKRKKYFTERRTTSHWPYRLKVNSAQPRTFGNTENKIDMEALVHDDLSDITEAILRML